MMDIPEGLDFDLLGRTTLKPVLTPEEKAMADRALVWYHRNVLEGWRGPKGEMTRGMFLRGKV